ncbi:HAD hydrolase family protein [Bacillus alkalicellulosilyticus]|uniref:HAD hydrolase family protein n=1 Tax=Alkalihalobacterium alkalicellulosilyticum TaxID=1912214 RepID=UPI0009973F8D
MFQLCGYPVAMGNAIEELKYIANNVTDTNDNAGVAKTLEAFKLQLTMWNKQFHYRLEIA